MVVAAVACAVLALPWWWFLWADAGLAAEGEMDLHAALPSIRAGSHTGFEAVKTSRSNKAVMRRERFIKMSGLRVED